MSENVRVILSLLTSGFTVDEIQKELKISPAELNQALKRIRDLGYNYAKSFSSDGTITIKASRNLNLNPKEHIKINVQDSTFHTILTSDFHVGGPHERAERIGIVADYAESHDIHTIFNAGDIINNYYPDQEPDTKVKDPIKQAQRYLRYAPQKERLIYFNLGGNHDYKSLLDCGFDSLRYYEDRRYDQISLGYGKCFIHLKEDIIGIGHEIKNTNNNIESTLIFRGHAHKYRNRENHIFQVPALTDNYQGAYEYTPIPGFLDAEFIFFDNKIYKLNLKQLAFIGTDIRLASEDSLTIRPEDHERYQKRLQKKKK